MGNVLKLNPDGPKGLNVNQKALRRQLKLSEYTLLCDKLSALDINVFHLSPVRPLPVASTLQRVGFESQQVVMI